MSAAAVLVVMAYRGRHPPIVIHAQPVVALPGDVGEYRVVTFTRGTDQWTASCARLRRARYALSLVDAPDAGGPGTWIQGAAFDANAAVAVNGGYFDEGRRPLGWRVAGGRETSPRVNRAPLSGVLFVPKGGDARIGRATDALPAGVETAMQSGPLLVEPGGRPGIRSDGGPVARRTVAATTADGDLLLITTSSVTLYELSKALLDSADSFGVDHVDAAINLDGGPSTAMFVRTPSGRSWTPPGGPVRDAILILPTEEKMRPASGAAK